MDSAFLATAACYRSGAPDVLDGFCSPHYLQIRWIRFSLAMSGGNAKLVPIVGTGALIGIFCSLTIDKIYPFRTRMNSYLQLQQLCTYYSGITENENKQWVKNGD